MRTPLQIMCCLAFLLFTACGKSEQTSDQRPYAPSECSFEIYNGHDTINKTYWGSKEGIWVYRHRGTDVVYERGFYKGNKKEGYWKRYNKTGELIDSVKFTADTPN